jgi:hypothetical protein
MSHPVENDLAAEAWLEIVRRKVGGMRFGSVQIVVHEGRVTVVESTEKTRLPDAGPAPTPAAAAKKRP